MWGYKAGYEDIVVIDTLFSFGCHHNRESLWVLKHGSHLQTWGGNCQRRYDMILSQYDDDYHHIVIY